MKKNWKPILALLVLSPLLTELLAVNLPISVFFQPIVFLLLVTVGYGFPVLIIREIAIRKNFGLFGLFFLGLIYGLYNEALLAKTIFHPFHSPIETFTAYGLVENIRVPWALVISSWHSLYAVLFPIVFVHYLFPSSAQETWIGKKTAWVLAFISLVFGISTFFRASPPEPRGQIVHFVVILACWFILWWLAKRASKTPKIRYIKGVAFSWKNLNLGGMLCLVVLVIPLVFSIVNLELISFILYFLLIATFGIHKLSKIQEIPLNKIVLIALGAEVSLAILTILVTLPFGKLEQAISSFVFVVIFTVIIFRLRKKTIQIKR